MKISIQNFSGTVSKIELHPKSFVSDFWGAVHNPYPIQKRQYHEKSKGRKKRKSAIRMSRRAAPEGG